MHKEREKEKERLKILMLIIFVKIVRILHDAHINAAHSNSNFWIYDYCIAKGINYNILHKINSIFIENAHSSQQYDSKKAKKFSL